MKVSTWRGDAAGGAYRAYEVPGQENQTALDVVTSVQRKFEPRLAHRFACWVGMCSSGAMTVNDIPRRSCRSRVKIESVVGKTLPEEVVDSLNVFRGTMTEAFMDHGGTRQFHRRFHFSGVRRACGLDRRYKVYYRLRRRIGV